MKALERHLYSRNGYLYYRSSIPQELRGFLPIKETVIALRIKDKLQARILVAQINQAERRILDSLEQELSALTADMSPEGPIVTAMESLEGLKDGLPHRTPSHFKTLPESKIRPKTVSPLLSEIVGKYLADCRSDAPKTLEQKRSTFALFAELQGDRGIDEIGISEAQAFKAALLRMPAHAKKRMKEQSLNSFAQDECEEMQKLHFKTINTRLGNMRSLFYWAERNGFHTGKNPFSGLAIKGQKATANRRSSFKPEEIRVLFDSPLYTGCKGKKWSERFETGDCLVKDALFWVPLIGLYSGMRLNEICQLELDDIRQEEGVWIFDVNDSGSKRLKTSSSARLIPIHHKLIEAGILEYWEILMRQEEARFFPDLKEGVNDSLSAPFSKRFRRVLNTLGLTRQGVCFHSLRHTFIDGLRKAGVERSIAMTLTGHQSSDVHDHYGNGYGLETLQKALDKVSFQVSA